MATDPTECRQFAARCMEVADSSLNNEVKQSMSNLANTWIKLAEELDRAQSISKQLNAVAQHQSAKD